MDDLPDIPLKGLVVFFVAIVMLIAIPLLVTLGINASNAYYLAKLANSGVTVTLGEDLDMQGHNITNALIGPTNTFTGVTITGTTFTNPSITGGTWTGATSISTNSLTAAAGSFTGNVTSSAFTGTGGTIDNTTIGATTAASVRATTIVGTDATNSTSPTTGALKTAGGAGIAGNAYIGGALNVAGCSTYGSRRVECAFTKNAIADNTATTIFRVTTVTGESGGYVVKTYTMAGANTGQTSGTDVASKSHYAHFARALNSGSGSNTAVSEISESAAAATNSGVTSVGTVTITVVETSELLNDIQILIDTTGSTATTGNVVMFVVLEWTGLTTAPVMTAQ